jgi:hypothetical protein
LISFSNYDFIYIVVCHPVLPLDCWQWQKKRGKNPLNFAGKELRNLNDPRGNGSARGWKRKKGIIDAQAKTKSSAFVT